MPVSTVVSVVTQVLGSFPQGALCPGDALCNGVVLGVSLGSTVICVGCPGPWMLVRKVRCAQVMLSAMVLSLVFSAMVLSLESQVGLVAAAQGPPLPEPVRCSLQGCPLDCVAWVWVVNVGVVLLAQIFAKAGVIRLTS